VDSIHNKQLKKAVWAVMSKGLIRIWWGPGDFHVVLVGSTDLVGSFLRFWCGHSRTFSGVIKAKKSKCPFGRVIFCFWSHLVGSSTPPNPNDPTKTTRGKKTKSLKFRAFSRVRIVVWF
jgi:hypothetical protein